MDKENYEVGFCKPPKSGRFKKGHSGNPKGRPKMSSEVRFQKDVVNIIMGEAQDLVGVNIGGKTVKMSSIEAAIKQLKIKALNGDFRSLQLFIDLTCKASVESDKAYEEMLSIVFQTVQNLQHQPDAFFDNGITTRHDISDMCLTLIDEMNEKY